MVLLYIGITALVVLSACKSSDGTHPSMPIEDMLAASVSMGMENTMFTVDAEPDASHKPSVIGLGRQITPPKICQTESGIVPWIGLARSPRIGDTLMMRFWLTGLSPGPAPGFELAPIPDSRDAWIIIGYRLLDPPSNFTVWGMRDCYVLVPIDSSSTIAYFPGNAPATYLGGSSGSQFMRQYLKPGEMMKREAGAGVIHVEWAIPDNSDLEGLEIYTQLIVKDPAANSGGYVSSICYKLTLGYSPSAVLAASPPF